MSKPKYITVSVSYIITQIAVKTEIDGYTKGVIESLLPDDDELSEWNEEDNQDWIKANNKRMKAICKFLNENNL